MKITKWDDDCIYFSDGSTITYDHINDCCENNWADFSVLELFYQQEEFVDFDIIPVEECGFVLSLRFAREPISPGSQWYYDYAQSKKILIPCYSDQNGYYSTDLTIIVHHPDGTSNNYPLYCELREL